MKTTHYVLYYTAMNDIKLIPLDYSNLPEDVIEILLLDSAAEEPLFDEVARANTHRSQVLHLILENPSTPEAVRQFVSERLHEPAETPVSEEFTEEHRTQTLLQRIQRLKLGDKIQLALKGSREIRAILLRDPNKEVAAAVFENPKITENEIEIMAKQKTTPEEVLRMIAKKREWMKKYSIIHAVVINPKTPPAIAVTYVNSLRPKDLLLLENNKFVSEAVRAAAKKLIMARKFS